MGDVKLNIPRVLVIREGYDDLEVQVANPDLIRWDQTRVKHKWPDFRSAPMLWLTFIAWAAARRTGAIPAEMRWETWAETVLEVRNLAGENAAAAGTPDDLVGSPFPEDPVLDSS